MLEDRRRLRTIFALHELTAVFRLLHSPRYRFSCARTHWHIHTEKNVRARLEIGKKQPPHTNTWHFGWQIATTNIPNTTMVDRMSQLPLNWCCRKDEMHRRRGRRRIKKERKLIKRRESNRERCEIVHKYTECWQW